VTEGRAGLRLKVLALLVVAMFAALTTRLWYLQVLAADRARLAASRNELRFVDVPAPRGRILDRNGSELVGNRLSIQVTVNREELGARGEGVVYRLARLLEVPVEELLEKLDTNLYYSYQPVPVATDVSRRVDFYIAEHRERFLGVETAEVPVRMYPFRKVAAHVLGYVGPISSDQLDSPAFEGYEQTDIVGQAGVEATYEQELQGTKGIQKFRVNAAGENLGEIGSGRPYVPGDDLYLAIDMRVQRLAERSLVEGMKASRGVFDEASNRLLKADAGAVVVLDPDNGQVYAMASRPSYDPKLFVRGFTEREFRRRFEREKSGSPLINRAIQGDYPPGSTYKPFIALSAMHRGLRSQTGSYSCPPSWTVPGDPKNVWHNWSSYDQGLMSLATALVKSCDTVFYPIGYEYWGIYYPPPNLDGIEGNDDLPPKEPLQRDLASFGFGRETGVDLPVEHSARVPTAEWKREIHERYPDLFRDGEWFPGDFVNMSIGQGDTLVTPLQLAAAFAAIQNGGKWCEPHLGLKVDPAGGGRTKRVEPRCHDLPLAAPQVNYVRDALTGVVRSGTAAGAFSGFPFAKVWIAGKTGTAEIRSSPPQQDYSWFAAMTEAGGEDYVVVALVEQGGHGSTTAAPIVRRVIEGLYGLPITPFPTQPEVTD
jgi:penicillin-binding protein 2